MNKYRMLGSLMDIGIGKHDQLKGSVIRHVTSKESLQLYVLQHLALGVLRRLWSGPEEV